MRVLITGGTGFLGRSFLRHGFPPDWDVTFSHQDLLTAWAGEEYYDLGIHLAANVKVAEGYHHPQVEWDSLSMLTNLLQGCRFGRFVYLSSGAVYDGLRGPVHPQVECYPTLPYAIAKLAGEQLVKFYQKKRKTIEEYVILRFFGAYGPGEPSHKLATRLLTATEPVVLRGNGFNLIDAMYIGDAVEMLGTIAQGSPANLTVDWASYTPLSIRQFVEEVGKVKMLPPVTYAGEIPEDIQFFSVHNVIRQYWGLTPTTSLPDGLRRLGTHLGVVA